MNIRNSISNIFNNSAVIGFIGVLIGSLITGIFAYKTQERIITSQENQFKSVYLIEKNKNLRNDISSFIENLSNFASPTSDKVAKQNILSNMNSIALKITLLEDYEIGINCSELTQSLEQLNQKGEFKQTEYQKISEKWIVSIKTEMKKIDYTIDSEEVSKDLLQLYLNGQLEK